MDSHPSHCFFPKLHGTLTGVTGRWGLSGKLGTQNLDAFPHCRAPHGVTQEACALAAFPGWPGSAWSLRSPGLETTPRGTPAEPLTETEEGPTKLRVG